MNRRHLSLTIQLETTREALAAREAWARVPEASRALLVEFAAEVIALAESAAAGSPSGVVVVPAEALPAILAGLATRAH